MAVVDSTPQIIATAQRPGAVFAWKWIGLNPTEIVVGPQRCIPRKALGLTGALLGGAGQTTITMARPLFICASSMALTGVGPPSATAKLSAEANCNRNQVLGTGRSSSRTMNPKAPLFIHRNGWVG